MKDTFAPGWPGIPARWTSSSKSGLGTAVSRDSRVWFTLSHGILNEIYSRKDDVDELCINAIRMLSIDAVQQANSGHPGMPMGAATMAYILWTGHLRHNPKNSSWPDRDRFVLSAGHGSMLLYSLLFLTGYDLTLQELQQFRQWKSRTPGHPEHGVTPGVEVTTGPLGQGVGNGVGLAIAERWLATTFNRPGNEVVDHYTYVLASDGDLMEGVAAEAASLAGTLKLGRLILLYDANLITLSATTNLTFTEDVGARFEAYGWHVQQIDGHDPAAVDAALAVARAVEDRPSLIVARTYRVRQLVGQGIRSRVVSMPCWELFDRQPQSYRDSVLPPSVRARVSIEAAAPFGWERYVGLEGAIIGVTDFGVSAPGPVVMREFGFTPERVVEAAKRVLKH